MQTPRAFTVPFFPGLFLSINRTIYGGPYRLKPENMEGIKCAQEVRAKYAMAVDIADYQVPRRPEQMQRAIAFALLRMADESVPLYAGCMGGIGRTGLFLACLTKALGVEDPVAYVRENYRGPNGERPIETPEQVAYVGEFDVASLQGDVRRARRVAVVHELLRPFRAIWAFFKRVVGIAR